MDYRTHHDRRRLCERVSIAQSCGGPAQDDVSQEPAARGRDEPKERPREQVTAPRDLAAHDGAPRDREFENYFREELPRLTETHSLEQPEVPRTPQGEAAVHVCGRPDPGCGLGAEAGAQSAAASTAQGGEDESPDGTQAGGARRDAPEVGGETPGDGARDGEGNADEEGGHAGKRVFRLFGFFGEGIGVWFW